MKSIILEKPGSFRLIDTPEPAPPGPHEVLVAVRCIGVCGTDLHAYRGKQPFFSYPRIVGHELGVEIIAVGGAVTHVAPGDCCAVQPYLECGTCIACRRGKGNCCLNLKVLGVHIDGGMRERIVIPAAKVFASRRLTLEQLALVETLGIGAHAVERVKPTGEDTVLVIGAGPIGLSVVQFACASGATVAVMDRDCDRLDFCRKHLSVEHVLDGSGDVPTQLKHIFNGDLPTIVFDATGNPQSMMSAFALPCHGGSLVFVGLFQGEVIFNDPEFHRREMTLYASRNATSADFTHIIGLIEADRIDTTAWVTHRAHGDDMISQFDRWLDPKERVIKAMVAF